MLESARGRTVAMIVGGVISVLGAGPVAAMLYAAKHLGAQKSALIEYTNSGKVTGDDSAVVGYAGIIIF